MQDTPQNYDFFTNILFSALAEFSSLFLFIFSILVARTVGPNDYGIFVFALSFGTIYSLFIRFDFLSYLNREIPLDKEKGTIKFHAVLGTQIWLVVISTLVMLPICIFLPKPGQEKVIILVISAAMVFHSIQSTFRGVLRGVDSYFLDSLTVLIERIMLLGVAILAFLNSWLLFSICLAFLVVRFGGCIFSLFIVSKKIKPKLVIDPKQVKLTIKNTWPFATMLFLFMIYNYSDSIMISLLRSNSEVGYYNVAYQVLEGSQLFPSSITGGLLPLLTINYLHNSRKACHLIAFSMEVIFYMAFPLVIFCYLFSTDIIQFLYGNEYIPAAPALQIIICSAPLFFLSIIARCAFYAAKKEKLFAKIFAISVVFNILLNLPFIYYFGFIGACITTFATELLVCVILLKSLKRFSYEYNLLSIINKPILLNFVLFIFVYLLRSINLHVLLSGVTMVIFYVAAIYLFKLISLQDLYQIRTAR